LDKYDPVEAWINNVCASHSNSNRTRRAYKSIFRHFCDCINKTANQIISEYEASTDREFKRQYAKYVRVFIASELEKGHSPNTINTRVGAISSFFKYNDLPLGFIPAVNLRVLYHNRDITHEEINLILESSRPRERAFFAIMAQSGLRPFTICKLKYENIKEDWEKKLIPCKIDVPQEIAKGKYHSHFTFIGEEAVKYLRSYLIVRPAIKNEDYLFLKEGTRQKVSPKSISRLFALTVKKLHEKGLMKLKQEQANKPHDIRLYNLRKFFRKYANQAGFEFVQFWMGHTVNAGQDDHYRPRDVEFHRELYAEKAMPHLRLETATPTETDKAITTLEQENKELKDQIERLETVMKKMYKKVFREEIEREEDERWEKEHPEHLEQIEQMYEQYKEMCRKEEEYLAKHPEERKRRKEEARKLEEEDQAHFDDEWIEEQMKGAEEQSIRWDERRKTLRELQDRDLRDIIKKSKKPKK